MNKVWYWKYGVSGDWDTSMSIVSARAEQAVFLTLEDARNHFRAYLMETSFGMYPWDIANILAFGYDRWGFSVRFIEVNVR